MGDWDATNSCHFRIESVWHLWESVSGVSRGLIRNGYLTHMNTMESLPPPPYTSPCLNTLTGAPVTGAAAPAYTPPSSYWVGVANTRLPFVHVPQIKDHLALLHAFSELKIQVEGLPDADIPLLPSDKERRWACFVGFAVER